MPIQDQWEVSCAPTPSSHQAPKRGRLGVVLSASPSTEITTTLSKGRATAEEVHQVLDCLYLWALSKGKGRDVAQKVFNCLDESFLLSLPAPKEKH